MEKENRIYTCVKKVTYSIFIGLALLLTVFHTTNVFAAAVEASHKEVNELTAEESAKLQKGLPMDLKDGDRVIYVYQATGSSDLAPTLPSEPGEAVPAPTPVANTLPNTGMNTDTVATMSLAIVAVGLAGYFIYKNKKSREFLLVVLAVGTGVFVAHNVSAATKTNLHEQIQARVRHAEYDLSQPQQDLEGFEYIGYVKLQAPVEQPTTVETTTQSTTATVTVPEETTQSTTVPVTVPEETTQTTTTTEEVKKGTYRRTLVIQASDFVITGNYDQYTQKVKKAASTVKWEDFRMSDYKFNHQGLKVLVDGKEVVPTKLTNLEIGDRYGVEDEESGSIYLPYPVVNRYKYVIDEQEGEIGKPIASTKRITFMLGDKEYKTLEELSKDFYQSYDIYGEYHDADNGRRAAESYPESFSYTVNNSVPHREFQEGQIEDIQEIFEIFKLISIYS